MREANRNQLWAHAFAEEVARAGVREVCVAPGSRSTPLVLAFDAQRRVRLTVHLDERSAAFFALGIGKATRRPAAVLTTSGTATANLFPAVIEASESETPLLVLTADRPHRLRDSDANQAVDQVRLYGSYVRRFFDAAPPRAADRPLRHLRTLAARAVAGSTGPPAGPVHVNFPFDKPLEPTPVPDDVDPDLGARHPLAAAGRPEGRPFVEVGTARREADAGQVRAVAELLAASRRGVVVAGPSPEPGRTGHAAIALAGATGFPLLADPLSGARYGPSGDALVIGGYDLALGAPEVREALVPDVVVRVGASPTSSALLEWLEAADEARQVVVDAGHRWKDHLSVASRYLQADPAAALRALAEAAPRSVDAAWRERWRRLERAVADVVERELDGELFEGAVLATVARSVPDDAALFVSNSMPVRDLDAFAGPCDRLLEVYGNRGASGIDGIVSTAIGVARGRLESVVAVLGDLAFYHDMNGLLSARAERGDVTFVVIHNDGGGIFHMLPIREHEPPFTPFFATPHGLDFRHAAELYDLPFRRIQDRQELRAALERAGSEVGSRVLEVRTDRERNRHRREEVAGAAGDAVRHALEHESQGGSG